MNTQVQVGEVVPDNLGDLDKEMSNLDLHNMPYRESSEPDWKVL